jgi:hypothetical protein
MEKYWFKTKKYWYGFTPISWAWWIATLIFTFFIITILYSHNFFVQLWPNKQEAVEWIIEIILSLWVFSYYFEKKTEWELRWRWWEWVNSKPKIKSYTKNKPKNKKK